MLIIRVTCWLEDLEISCGFLRKFCNTYSGTEWRLIWPGNRKVKEEVRRPTCDVSTFLPLIKCLACTTQKLVGGGVHVNKSVATQTERCAEFTYLTIALFSGSQ